MRKQRVIYLMGAVIVVIAVMLTASPAYTAGSTMMIFQPNTSKFKAISTITASNIEMVPFREMMESFGASIQWHEDTKTAEAIKAEYTVAVEIGSSKALFNGEVVPMTAACRLIGGVMYVPLNFITDVIKPVVHYDENGCLKLWDAKVFIAHHGWTQLSDGYIAHAGGGLNGEIYLNTMEAIENAYANGHRVFEIDFLLTTDGQLAAVHDWSPYNGQKSAEEWRKIKIAGLYQSLFVEDVFSFMLKHEDAFLVTDIKSFQSSEENIKLQFAILTDTAQAMGGSLIDRMVPQVYNQPCYDWLMETYPYDSVIYTLYVSPDTDREVLEFIAKHDNISTVTLSQWRDSPRTFYSEINALSKYVYFFTENIASDIVRFREWGVHGIYTDFLTP